MKRRLKTIGGIFSLVLLIVLTFSTVHGSGEQPAGGPWSLTILHVNDTHSHLLAESASFSFEGVKTYFDMGGYGRLAAQIKALRSETDRLLLLHAGDAIQGSLFGFMTQGVASIDFMNFIGFDVMVVGNHEFDYGPKVLSRRIGEARFPILGANVDASEDPDLKGLLKPYVIEEVDGRKIGIIGLVTPQTAHSSKPGKNVAFEDVVLTARKYVAELTDRHIDRIVLLTHQGYEEDLKLAKAVAGVDIIVGGHSHTYLGSPGGSLGLKPQGPYPTIVENGSRVCVVQAWAHTNALGRLDVDFDDQGRVTRCGGQATVLIDRFKQKDGTGQKVAVSPEVLTAIQTRIDQGPPEVRIVAEDPDTVAHLKPYVEKIQALREEVIGRADETLNGGSAYRVPLPEGQSGSPEGCQLAAHVCSSMLKKVRDNHFDVHLAILNAGSVRTSLQKGDIRLSDAYDILPFSNTLVLVTLTGQEIKKTIEEAIALATRKDRPATGAFPYLGDARYAAEGSTITRLELAAPDGTWKPVDPEAVYRVVVNGFIAGGGDEYRTLAEAAVSHLDTGFIDNAAFIDYIKDSKTLAPKSTNVDFNGLHPF